ncbi:MAG: cation:proton antiporter [Promicromonosporaceae bacterium]|nr:cation:proton antiporter [Promicromonosporaceae bacterium]
MTFAQLALIGLVALLGPALAFRQGWHLPVVLGELLAGIAIGRTGLAWVDSSDATFAFLADLGFALVMFVAGTHVPLRNPKMLPALKAGIGRAFAVGVVAAGLGIAVASAVGTRHAPLYAVLMASSSAALILPIIDNLGLGGPSVVGMLPQVAIADSLCIVALPLAIDPAHAPRAALGAGSVIVAAVLLGLVYRLAEKRGWGQRVHDLSEARGFALELRVQLAILAALAALAAATHVTIMLAGFAFGLAVAAVGEPRRLANQLFALTEGFFGPLYFVWLGASLNLRDFGDHPRMIALGLALGLGAAAAHLVGRLFGQPAPLALLAAAQLGVPVSAVTVGTQLGVLAPGEAAALILGALVTIAFAVLGGARASAAGLTATSSPSTGSPPRGTPPREPLPPAA